MPELPEVEHVRRGLERAGLCTPVLRVRRSRLPLRTGKHWARKEERLRSLQGATPGAVRRRGKFLVWEFCRDAGPKADLGLVVHLGMTGACRVHRDGEVLEPHTHARLSFEDGREWRFVDPRRFGGLHAGPLHELESWGPLGELGPEPLGSGFDGAALARVVGRSKRAVRECVLDQRAVAGVGNIYVSEALFEAGLHPLLRADRLRPTAWDRLARAIVMVLERGIANGGTTLRDYRGVEGEAGQNQHALLVYGRAGQPCHRCGARLVGYTHQGRSGVYCPEHQRRPKTRRVA